MTLALKDTTFQARYKDATPNAQKIINTNSTMDIYYFTTFDYNPL